MQSNPTNIFGPYIKGAAEAAFGVFLFGGFYTEQQIEMVKEAISRFKESEIDQSLLPQQEKESIKRQWKQWLDAYVDGFKGELKRQGRLS